MFHTIAVDDEHMFSQNTYFQGSAGPSVELDVDLKHVYTYPYTC